MVFPSLHVPLDFQGKLFCVYEVFSIGSTLIHPTEVLQEAIGVETMTIEFSNNAEYTVDS